MVRLGSKEGFIASPGSFMKSGLALNTGDICCVMARQLGPCHDDVHCVAYQVRSGSLPPAWALPISNSLYHPQCFPWFYIYDLRGRLEWTKFSRAD